MDSTDHTNEVAHRSDVKQGWAAATVKFIFAIGSIKRQAAILKHRSSFPILRQAWARHSRDREMAAQKQLIQLQELSEQQLFRSRAGHLLILCVMVPVAAWALLTLARGLAAYIRFDVSLLINPWLMTGIPLTLFSAIKIATSLKALRLFSGEIEARSGNNA